MFMGCMRYILINAVLFAVLLCVGFSSCLATEVGGREALIIGVSDYRDNSGLDDLSNPKNDARLIHNSLRSIGFKSVLMLDPSMKDLKKAVSSFSKKAENAAIALFYFAGHGFQIGGQNSLMPSDAKIRFKPIFSSDNTFNLSDITNAISDSHAVKIIILDACRNDPRIFGRQSQSKHEGPQETRSVVQLGFSEILSTSINTYIIFSTAPGEVASDGVGANSPFTAAFSRQLSKPGLEIDKLMKQVTSEVKQVTDTQIPWKSSSLAVEVKLHKKGLSHDQGTTTASIIPPVMRKQFVLEEVKTVNVHYKAIVNDWIYNAPNKNSLEIMPFKRGTRFFPSKRTADKKWLYVSLSNGAKGFKERDRGK